MREGWCERILPVRTCEQASLGASELSSFARAEIWGRGKETEVGEGGREAGRGRKVREREGEKQTHSRKTDAATS